MIALCEKCLYSELFWSGFSRIWTEYGEIRSISPYSVRMRENRDQNHSEYGHFSCSGSFRSFLDKIVFSLCLRQIFAIHHPEILNLLKKTTTMNIKCIHLTICQINLKQLVTSEEAGCFGQIVYLNLHILGLFNCPPQHKIWQNTGFP